MTTISKLTTLLILFYSINNFSQNFEKSSDNKIYDLKGIEVPPEFPGGLEKLNSYLGKVSSDTKAKTKSKVYVMFVVEKNGSLSDIKVIGKIDSSKSEELIGLLKNSPKWNPGKQNETIVRVRYVIPL